MTTGTRRIPAAVGALAGVPAKVLGVATGPSGRICVGWASAPGYQVFQPKVHF